MADINAALKWAAKRKCIDFTPVLNYKLPKRYDDQVRPPSPNETIKILEHNAAHLIRAISLSHYTGIRPGASELLNRVWNDVDFDAQTLFIVSTKNGEEGDHKSSAEIIGHSRTEASIWILSAYRS